MQGLTLVKTILAASISMGLLIVLLTGCAQVPLKLEKTQDVAGGKGKNAGGNRTDEHRTQGYYKVGTPYQIQGRWYHPKVDYTYDETGMASWYGPKFNGKLTANGEIYNMMALTAAHRTLPLPTWVEVTNLDNGRRLRLRINDRGPYAKNRIIDISKRGAQLLGFQKQGVAKVRVRVLAEESKQVAILARQGAKFDDNGDTPTVADKVLPQAVVRTNILPEPKARQATPSHGNTAHGTDSRPAKTLTQETKRGVTKGNGDGIMSYPMQDDALTNRDADIFIQVGAFSVRENAHRVMAVLSTMGDVNVSNVVSGGRQFYRVRVGPMGDSAEAGKMLERIIDAGYGEAKIMALPKEVAK